jgi:hypothetical protein
MKIKLRTALFPDHQLKWLVNPQNISSQRRPRKLFSHCPEEFEVTSTV